MTPDLKKEIRDRLVHFARHEARERGSDAFRAAEIEHEIDVMLALTRTSGALKMRDSGAEQSVLRKLFPAGLPGLDDLRELPESPQVLLEQAAHKAGIIGHSTALLDVVHNALLLAQTSARVLISGETGTGKDMLARLIHAHSLRRHKPLVVVNCGAMSPQLAQSELFGHEPHSFTGADPRGRKGKVEAADEGTLFLDEVADLPMVAQVALLRLLDHGEIQKVGRATPQHVNVRVISATHRDILRAVREGAFREDLYFRLFVAELRVPALRERGTDVLLLAAHLLNVLKIEYGRAHPHALSDETRALFQRYAWPGNIRQMRHVLEHAFIRTSREQLLPSDFPMLTSLPTAVAANSQVNCAALRRDVEQCLGQDDHDLSGFIMKSANGWFTVSEAAAGLTISVSSVRNRFRDLAAAGILQSEGERRGRRYRLARAYCLDFSSQNPDINRIGKLGGE